MGEFKLVLHDFLDDFDAVRHYADGCDFSGAVNPVDGVEYPGICTEIPVVLYNEVVNKLSNFFGKPMRDVNMFMRLSLAGDKPPHAAHNDATMGALTFMLYLTRDEHAAGGTSFVKHATEGMEHGVVTPAQQKIWKRDTNKRECWRQTDTVKMRQNKALVFNSNLMHWAESPYAFGDSAANGRLMLICFFNL